MPTRLSNLNFFIIQDRSSSVLRRWHVGGIFRCHLRVDPHSLLRDRRLDDSADYMTQLLAGLFRSAVSSLWSAYSFSEVFPGGRRRDMRKRLKCLRRITSRTDRAISACSALPGPVKSLPCPAFFASLTLEGKRVRPEKPVIKGGIFPPNSR
jgi:hypothetical protein